MCNCLIQKANLWNHIYVCRSVFLNSPKLQLFQMLSLNNYDDFTTIFRKKVKLSKKVQNMHRIFKHFFLKNVLAIYI